MQDAGAATLAAGSDETASARPTSPPARGADRPLAALGGPRPVPPARRFAAVALALLATVVIDVSAPPPASAASLRASIASARRGQQRAADAMRRADLRIAELRRLRHSGRGHIRRAANRLERARHRYARVHGRRLATRERLHLARLELDRALRVRPNPSGQQVGVARGPRRDVRRLRSNVRQLRQRERRRDAARDRARREKRRLLRSVGMSHHGVGAVIARRERAESILGYHIDRMVGLAQRKAARKTSASPASTGFRKPARGRVTQRFGCTGYRREPRRGSCSHFHDGVDIAARSGTRVRAAAAGVVAYVGWNPWDHPRRAYIVIIGHRGGFQTVYGHLRPIRRTRVGRVVRKGKVIGSMGSTGNSTGPHVHWEVRKGSTAVDPARYR